MRCAPLELTVWVTLCRLRRVWAQALSLPLATCQLCSAGSLFRSPHAFISWSVSLTRSLVGVGLGLHCRSFGVFPSVAAVLPLRSISSEAPSRHDSRRTDA